MKNYAHYSKFQPTLSNYKYCVHVTVDRWCLYVLFNFNKARENKLFYNI